MKCLDVSIILSVSFFIFLFIMGCPNVQQSRLEDALHRGATLHGNGQYDQAISDYTRAIEINPKDADAYNNRGTVYHYLGYNERACADFQKACELGFCMGLNLAREEGVCQ